MTTTVDEIAPDLYRISTFVPEIGPTGFTFNQFLVRDDEPFLFHTGTRQMFPAVAEAVARVLPVTDLRWISFGHVEADECGAMNQFLAAAPDAQVVHGELACMVSLNNLADRAPRAMAADEVLVTGRHHLRFLPTPHVPHNWESGLWFDESDATLFAGDLFTALGNGPAVTTDGLLDAAVMGEEVFHATSVGAATAPTIRGLADLGPRTLATMHGSSFSGDAASQLLGLADVYEAMLTVPV
ncbi:MAG: oxygen-binding di-iron domain-containing protein [Acidimicrobiia bacterium]